MGRPKSVVRFTPEMIVEALKAAKGAVYLAAEALGCTPETIYGRAKTSAIVRETIQKERGKIIDIAELKLYEAVQAGESWAIQFMLRTLGKDRGYIEKTDITMELVPVHTLTDAQLERIANGRGISVSQRHATKID